MLTTNDVKMSIIDEINSKILQSRKEANQRFMSSRGKFGTQICSPKLTIRDGFLTNPTYFEVQVYVSYAKGKLSTVHFHLMR